MNLSLLLLSVVLAGGLRQASSLPVAGARPDSLPAAWIAANPDQARDTLRQWLAGSADADPERGASMLARATALAYSYLHVWGDSFPLREATRFAAWPHEVRARRVRADSLRRAGNVAFGSQGLPAALCDWRASLTIGRELGDSGTIASALGNMGTGFYREAALDSAEALFTEARRLATIVGDRRTMLNASGGLASIHKDRGEYREAATAYTETLALRRQIGDYRGVAADANNLGLVAAAIGDMAEARRRHTEALVTAREHGLDVPAAAALLNLGALAADLGQEHEAEARYLGALELYHRLGQSTDEALVLQNLGLLDAGRGEYPAATKRYQAALRILAKTGPVEQAVAARRDLAMIHAAMGRLDQATEQLTLATTLARTHGLSTSTTGRLQLARGDLALAFNHMKTARTAFTAGLTLFRRERDGAGEADALAALGGLRLLEEDHAAARQLFTDAASRQQQLGDRRSAALTRLLLAQAEQALGDSAAARRSIALAMDTLVSVGDPVAEAWGWCQLAEQQRAVDLPLAAEASYHAGLSRLGRKAAPGVAICLTGGLGEALRARGNWREAVTVLSHGVALVENAAGRVTVPGQRADFLSDKWQLYTELALAQRSGKDDSAAFATSERLRARQTLDLLARGPGARSDEAESSMAPRAAALRRRITALLAIAEAPGTTVALRGADAIDQFSNTEREALSRAQDAYAELLDSVEATRPGANTTQLARTPTWRDVAGHLGAEDALVEYLMTDSAVVAFVVTSDRLATVDLPVSGTELASEVEFVRGALVQTSGTGRGTAWQAPFRRLNGQLIAPLENAGLLQGKRHLVLVPHGELHYLPFAALLEQGTHGRFLVERYEVGSVSSAAVWLELQSRPVLTAPGRVLALAPRTSDLPGTGAEVATIASLYGQAATVLRGPQATRRAFVDSAAGYGILHLATLGVLNKHNPQFSYVGLAAGNGTDGRLEVHDVARLAIDARLVVLSACQTGLGSGRVADVPSGDDWVGLVQAFQSAGARNVLATLWPVDDRATADLMQQFYAQLRAGSSERSALATAQRHTLAQAATRSPFYWAGFVLDGRL